MNPTSEDIKDMLLESESGLNLIFATDLFIGKEPSRPDNCVTVFDTPGFPSQLTTNKDEIYNYPSIQIRVRNKSYLTGYTLAKNIMDYLHGRAHETWNSTYYSVIRAMTDPHLLDWDENDRARFVLTFNIQRR